MIAQKSGWETTRLFLRTGNTGQYPIQAVKKHIRKRGTKSRSLAGKYPRQPAKV